MRLSQEWLTQQGNKVGIQKYPERILQIGEGNFMRGFVDWLIHRLNAAGEYQGRVVVAKPLSTGDGKIREWNAQDGLYTVWRRGVENGKLVDSPEVVQSVSRCINPYTEWEEFMACAQNPEIDIVTSNTTEAGLAYVEEAYVPGVCPTSFPAKLTAYLYERYQRFQGDADYGLEIVPCELVENNGNVLRELVLRYVTAWGLPDVFANWIKNSNHFYNTLVDSIVTGFNTADPELLSSRMAYEDRLGAIREPFYLWVIQGDGELPTKLNFPAAGLNVRYVEDVAPFLLIKVRILNGAHTSLAGLSFLAGLETVREAVTDGDIGPFVRSILQNEIIPALARQGVLREEADSFATAVLERFENPLLRHEIASLQLNGLSKIAVRILPSLNDYLALTGELPRGLVLAIAGQLLYYRNAQEPEHRWVIKDNREHVQRVQAAWERVNTEGMERVASEILAQRDMWGQDLTGVRGLVQLMTEDLLLLEAVGIRKAVADYVQSVTLRS